jgi:hypothetical protein
MEKITCPLCGSDQLIKLQMKRVTRSGKVPAVYCCAADVHMFFPEIQTNSSGTTARSGKRQTRRESAAQRSKPRIAE